MGCHSSPRRCDAALSAATLQLTQIQRRLEAFYRLESGPDISHFVRPGTEGSREMVLIRQDLDGLELAVVLPPAALGAAWHEPLSDSVLQAVEGVSHFVYLAERARTELPTTRLELELQAEVDKFVLLAVDQEPATPHRARGVHDSLYRRVRHIHPPESEVGARYRLANELAARLSARLLDGADPVGTRRLLCHFYRSGQADKIRLARAA